jgi:CxxC motif-containing protein (DUF1111 family)
MNPGTLAWPRRLFSAGIAFAAMASLSFQGPGARAQGSPITLGQPLPGISAAQQAAFLAGQAQYETVETAETGLGPLYNGTSCSQCHSKPAMGGASGFSVTRFGQSSNGVFNPLTSEGGTLFEAHATIPQLQDVLPADANVTAKRITTPTFGDGLIDAIPDSEIALNAVTPQPDGVHGEVSIVLDVVSGDYRVGRFGWKAQQATLLAFSGDAFDHEMGITNRLYPVPVAPDGNYDLLAQYESLTAPPKDEVDPTTGKAGVDRLTDFMRYLAPPLLAAPTPQSRIGNVAFATAGCAVCHIPAMMTGPSSDPAFNVKMVALYSDLLLHDMGTLGDGIAQGTASPSQMRTSPLWGLRTRTIFLHDGRATTVDAAIRAHDGEGAVAAGRYRAMPSAEQQALLAFLQTL